MRRALFSLALLLTTPAMADEKAKLPPDLQSLPDIPPPPPGVNLDAAPEVEERIVIKVTPKIGAPYYLVDHKGDGSFARQEGLDSGIRPPQWILHKF